MNKILLLPGDGIGPEIIDATRQIMDWFRAHRAFDFEVEDAPIGGIAYEKTGRPDPDETIEKAQKADAVLLGAVGGPQWDNLAFELKPERGLLRLRKEMNVFANLRPALCFKALQDASTLKPEIVSGLDLLIVRELMGGVYFGTPKERIALPDGQVRAIDTQVYTTGEIERVARVAFDLARLRRGLVTSVEKSNVMLTGLLWRQTVSALHADHYPDVELNHMLADSCAMQLVRNPKQFDVIVTDNLFGDVLSDEAAQLTGSIGMLPSASLGAPVGAIKRGLYEPIHGSAPDIAGQDVANPIATILSFAMCLKYTFGREKDAALLSLAVEKTLDGGYRTADIMQPNMTKVGTTKMAGLILQALRGLTDLT
ncbi:MAG: 3-isopropylmalate dehydrogenase [Pseudomonadota bacterium]